MSLRVWLPLNGDLQNKGLDDVNIVNNGATVSNSGKIGKCYQFGQNNGHFILSPYNFYNNKYSFSAWIYTKASSTQGICTCRNGTRVGFAIFLYQNKLRIDGGTNDMWKTSYSYSQNEWFHLTVVYDGLQVSYYINGVFKEKKAITLNANTWGTITSIGASYVSTSSPGNYLKGYMNDVRIYDHALSVKQIKQISKGLILHYKLDNNGMGCPNILTGTYYNSYDPSLASIHGVATNSAGIWKGNSGGNGTFSVEKDETCPIGEYSWNVNNNTSGNRDFQQEQQPFVNGQKYTTSFWAKGNGTCLYRSWNRTDNKEMFQKTWALTNDWKYYTHTFTASQEMETDNCTFHLGVTGNANISICGMKMELGSIATPYSVAKGELGANTQIYDSSGYQNNGVITGNVQIVKDSPKYGNGIYINSGNEDYITSPVLNLPGDAITMSFWFKSNNTSPGSNYHIPLNGAANSSYSYQMSIYKNGCLRYGLYLNGSRSVHNTSVTNILNGQWHMYTMTYDGSAKKVYLDSILVGSQNVTGTLTTSTNFVIGHYGNNFSYYNKETYMSDLRIYTTALSEDDIKELYQTSILIDKNKNFYSKSYIENNENNEIQYLYNLVTNGSSSGASFYQNQDGLHLDQRIWVMHDYIPIDPTNKIYKYDIIYSNDIGNNLYVGWERFDANKTSRSNSATTYVIASAAAADYKRITGVVNLSTDGVNPCAFIRLRILNKWTRSSDDTMGTATIHSLSLKQFETGKNITPLNISRQGIVNTTSILEKNIGVSINKSFDLNSNNFYEI